MKYAAMVGVFVAVLLSVAWLPAPREMSLVEASRFRGGVCSKNCQQLRWYHSGDCWYHYTHRANAHGVWTPFGADGPGYFSLGYKTNLAEYTGGAHYCTSDPSPQHGTSAGGDETDSWSVWALDCDDPCE